MSDIADRAEKLEEQARQRGIQAARYVRHEKPEINEQGKRICKDCGEVISQRRLLAISHAVRCVSCQEEHEGGNV